MSADLLKDIYSKSFFEMLSKNIKNEIDTFDEAKFIDEIFSSEWASLELKQRMSHIARVLSTHLNAEYNVSLHQICSIIKRHKIMHSNGFNFEFMFFPEYIQLFGLEDFDNSIKAIEEVTQFTSCEFVVRHFILRYPQKMILQMQNWANHPHHYVRRLSSEGMRTRLPWAIGVKELKENPQYIFPILEKLILDDSDWVRKSVSNSLNDLSKDYPILVIDFIKKWKNTNIEIDRALKHASRTLLKQGNHEVLAIFGVNTAAKFVVKDFHLQNKVIPFGGNITFHFELENLENSAVFVRLEYKIYFLRMNGIYNAKVFKISEKNISSKSKISLDKTHSFKSISTRKYYAGMQKISLIINGIESENLEFLLDMI